ncbi:hypothetical protein [Inconstantimicrobium mannanitabidum]|uniref:Uncharacterized protein n=1 Tax=Inconstantimicrobium mannanitabidum TaxID=1604901 RepID=A0ACB5RD55_9CLOT|nr:hypothetical protein [Clostridium sp. TW13]GKX67025.1 hypothetical protein rsdtw13_22830 [Clostridium sp. TW13]
MKKSKKVFTTLSIVTTLLVAGSISAFAMESGIGGHGAKFGGAADGYYLVGSCTVPLQFGPSTYFENTDNGVSTTSFTKSDGTLIWGYVSSHVRGTTYGTNHYHGQALNQHYEYTSADATF